MKDVYEVAGVSKQALHQHRIRELQKHHKRSQFFEQADKIRKEHPGAGCRKMALGMTCRGWGRDKIEHLLLGNGYRLYHPPNYVRTTWSLPHLQYPNLIEGMELTNINQVVQTDITYYKVGDRFYYLVFLIDVYSRRITGFAVNKGLQAEGNIKALNRMLQTRKNQSLKAMIHHSDRGSQYIDAQYLNILNDNNIEISMCKAAWENAYTERINRTIKREYLDGWQINSFSALSKAVTKAVNHYNTKRGHSSLKKQTPQGFEQHVRNLPENKRIKMRIFKRLENYPPKSCE
jgi:putative transposase